MLLAFTEGPLSSLRIARGCCGSGRTRTCSVDEGEVTRTEVQIISLRMLSRVYPSGYPYRSTLPLWRAGPRLSNKHLDGFKTPACSPVHVSFVSVVEASVSELSSSVTSRACSGFPWVQSCSSAFRTDYRIVVASVHLVCPFVATLRCTWSRCRELSPSGELRLRLLLRGSQGRGCPR